MVRRVAVLTGSASPRPTPATGCYPDHFAAASASVPPKLDGLSAASV